MEDLASFKATVYGTVQGVGFRFYTRMEAKRLGINGYVRNLPGGESVEAGAEGEKAKLEKFVEFLASGPPLARVDSIEVHWSEHKQDYTDFSINR
ncbi:acylphosphatase [Chloroflexota bacterium]